VVYLIYTFNLWFKTDQDYKDWDIHTTTPADFTGVVDLNIKNLYELKKGFPNGTSFDAIFRSEFKKAID
jgi:hypothetical protein